MVARRFPTDTFIVAALLAVITWGFWYLFGGGQAVCANLADHWQISLTMIFGSLIAGATSEGGGAVAFPVFTKLLDITAQDAKVFSLAIQSVGMSAASLVIISMGVRVEWRVIYWVSIGGIAGITLGAAVIAPLISQSLIKMLFTVMLTSFALTLIALNRNLPLRHMRLPRLDHAERGILLLTGFIGGTTSGLVGNGIDIVAFSVMVLLFRINEKIATPTSVILMAINALVGFLLHLTVLGGFTAEVKDYWLAAIPVVVVGAPLGAMICNWMDRIIVVRVLIMLIAIELISSLLIIPLTMEVIMVSLISLIVFFVMYYTMYRSDTYAHGKLQEQQYKDIRTNDAGIEVVSKM